MKSHSVFNSTPIPDPFRDVVEQTSTLPTQVISPPPLPILEEHEVISKILDKKISKEDLDTLKRILSSQ
jgi:hypothetical protein